MIYHKDLVYFCRVLFFTRTYKLDNDDNSGDYMHLITIYIRLFQHAFNLAHITLDRHHSFVS